jgi:flagellar assembly protein FliH
MSDISKPAFQRWEFTSFGDERPSVVAKRQPPTPAEPAEPPPPPLAYPTEEELAAIRDAARQQGLEQGVQDGFAAGHAEGLALGRAEAATELEHLRAIAATFSAALAQADETMAGEVLDLALQLARGMLRTALEVKPELVLPVVREAIAYLPTVQQPALLILHPDDAAIVREDIGMDLEKGGWRIVDDAQLARGGCKIDTASNQIDAQPAARWQRLTQALGKDLAWIDQHVRPNDLTTTA